ncbi:hypothetical protein TNCV_1852481 [Trichonephila clavipes]|nr:hypothetical protein TNCV_1852481 [Trichonephila clavipes]
MADYEQLLTESVNLPSTFTESWYLFLVRRHIGGYRAVTRSYTRAFVTDHVILNHGQVMWLTPELAPPSPNYHTTTTGGRLSSRKI